MEQGFTENLKASL